MQDSENEFNPGSPPWWDEEEQTDETIKKWKESVSDYMNYRNEQAEDLKFSKALVLRIIPHTGVKDPRWYKFPRDEFITNKHKAHKKLYETMRNHIGKL